MKKTVTGFIIVDDEGNPLLFDLHEDDHACTHSIVGGVHVFDTAKDAKDVMNSAPGSSGFEGLQGATVRSVKITVSDVIIAEQEEYEGEDDEDCEEDEDEDED